MIAAAMASRMAGHCGSAAGAGGSRPGGALDQGADRGGAVRADDQVALPMSGHRPVFHFGRPSEIITMFGIRTRRAVTCRRGCAEPGRCAGRRSAPGAARPALDVEGLVDRLVGHAHLTVVGMVLDQASGDLLRAPPLGQPILHAAASRGLADSLPSFGRWARDSALAWAVLAVAGRPAQHAVAGDLPSDGGLVPPIRTAIAVGVSPAAIPTAISSARPATGAAPDRRLHKADRRHPPPHQTSDSQCTGSPRTPGSLLRDEPISDPSPESTLHRLQRPWTSHHDTSFDQGVATTP